MVSQSPRMAVRRCVLSTLARIAGVVNTPPKAMVFVPGAMQTCPRRRASLATNERRGGQVVFGAQSWQATLVREAIIAALPQPDRPSCEAMAPSA